MAKRCFLAWAWLAKPKAKVIMPNFNPRQSIYGKTRVKVQSTACTVSHYAKNEAPLENIIGLDSNIIIGFKFITNFDRCAILIVSNCPTKNFEP